MGNHPASLQEARRLKTPLDGKSTPQNAPLAKDPRIDKRNDFLYRFCQDSH